MVNVFAVPVFFICFRESLETAIIVSVLLSFLKQTMGPEKDPVLYKKLRKQVWLGVGIGLAICVAIGVAFIAVFYTVGANYFAQTENIWEGVFCLIAALIITVMGGALLRISKLQEKWHAKLSKALAVKEKGDKSKGSFKQWCEKYAMFMLPLVTVLREGLEAVVFIGGVALGLNAEAFPLAVFAGLGAGTLVGYLIYRGGVYVPLQVFLVVSTCFMYLVAAGLFSRGVWTLEQYSYNQLVGGDASETGSGPGSYDIRQSVWHVNCCNPKLNGGGGWGVFQSLLGWTNSATYGSVISYNLYWIVIIIGFLLVHYKETHGHLPLQKARAGRSLHGGNEAQARNSQSPESGDSGEVDRIGVSEGKNNS